MIGLDSGDPTRLICSVLIAQAFGKIGYPILPAITRVEGESARQEIYHIRDSSLYTPRDFDISPYFAVIKPTIETGFNNKSLTHKFSGFLSSSCQSAREESNRGEEYPSLG